MGCAADQLVAISPIKILMKELATSVPEDDRRTSIGVGSLARVVLSCVLLVLVLRQIQGGEVLHRLFGADIYAVVIALILFGIALWLAAVRWWVLVRASFPQVSLLRITWLTLVGHFFGQILLGAIAGDVVKAAYLMSQGNLSKAQVALSVGLDRIVGLCVIVLLVATALPFRLDRLTQHPQLGWSLALSASLVLFAGLLSAFILWRFSRPREGRRPEGWRRRFAQGAVGEFAASLRSNRWSIAQSLIVASLGHLCFFASAYWLAEGLGIDLSWVDSVLVMGAVVVVTSIPISIGGHGVREGVLVLMFSALEILPEGLPIIDICLAFSVSFVAINWSWALVAGAAYIFVQLLPVRLLTAGITIRKRG